MSYFVLSIDTSSISECFAMTHSKFGSMQSIEVETSKKICGDQIHKCFVTKQLDIKDVINGKKEYFHCDGEDATRCGVVACKTLSTGYYPVGFYTDRKGLCSFLHVKPVMSLSPFYKIILDIIENPRCPIYYPAPVCPGHRCRLGECLKADKICNGKFDCHDGSDEDAKMCLSRKDGGNFYTVVPRCNSNIMKFFLQSCRLSTNRYEMQKRQVHTKIKILRSHERLW